MTLDDSGLNQLLDFVVPRLNFSVSYHDLSAMSELPNLDVEEFAISLTDYEDGHLNEMAHFMNRTQRIRFVGLPAALENSEALVNVFCSLWHQLRSLECNIDAVSLTVFLNVLHQAQSLEHCNLAILNAGNGPLVAVSMPNLRSVNLCLHSITSYINFIKSIFSPGARGAPSTLPRS